MTTSAMDKFLVQVAVAMQPFIYVPAERPPTCRLYVITNGRAKYGGNAIGPGESWGAQDVLLKGQPNSMRLRATAVTYLHVLWVGPEVFDLLRAEYPAACIVSENRTKPDRWQMRRSLTCLGAPCYCDTDRLTKLWAMIRAMGTHFVREYHAHRRDTNGWRLRIGRGEDDIAPEALEQRLNSGDVSAVKLVDANGAVAKSPLDGNELWHLRYGFATLDGYEIIKEGKIDEK